jgi:membrane protease YdiL (CAAX protease family)
VTEPFSDSTDFAEPPPLRPEPAGAGLPADGPPPVRWRWWVHLLTLAAYPVTIGLLSTFIRDRGNSPALSDNLAGLFLTVAQTYAFFGFFFGIAWLASRAGRDDLLLRWRGGWRNWLFGFGYSVALQITVRIVVIIVLFGAIVVMVIKHGGPVTAESINQDTQHLLQRFRPETEKLVNGETLVSNPLYLLATVTVVSFVMAGFTEELWRSGMLAGFRALFPAAFGTQRGKVLFIFLVATVFGLGHLPQGAGAVVLTGVIGLQLGAIMLFHRSMWIPALAHGFFDATSFLTLWYVQSHPQLLQELQKYLHP